VFNLEECMNNEFLRARENRCKWFNVLRVMKGRLYIERSGKTKFLHKIKRVNRFTKWVNWFRQQKTTQECMKDETIQCICESIQVSPDEEWYDSTILWIDLVEVREFRETIQTKRGRFKCDTIQEDVNRFI